MPIGCDATTILLPRTASSIDCHYPNAQPRLCILQEPPRPSSDLHIASTEGRCPNQRQQGRASMTDRPHVFHHIRATWMRESGRKPKRRRAAAAPATHQQVEPFFSIFRPNGLACVCGRRPHLQLSAAWPHHRGPPFPGAFKRLITTFLGSQSSCNLRTPVVGIVTKSHSERSLTQPRSSRSAPLTRTFVLTLNSNDARFSSNPPVPYTGIGEVPIEPLGFQCFHGWHTDGADGRRSPNPHCPCPLRLSIEHPQLARLRKKRLHHLSQ
jgi:hypothetical protein